ncbi:unnamed protein product [Gordionus sp. m RMFG-2023]
MRRDSLVLSQLFESYINADSFLEIISVYREICERLNLFPKRGIPFYQRLKSKIKCWKALALWTKLDKKCSQKVYRQPNSCQNINAIVIKDWMRLKSVLLASHISPPYNKMGMIVELNSLNLIKTDISLDFHIFIYM